VAGTASERDSKSAISLSGTTTWQYGMAMLSASMSWIAFMLQGLAGLRNSSTFRSTAIDGILALAASPHLGPVNIGSDHEMTVLQIAALVLGITRPASPVSFIPRPADDPSRRRPDVSRARDLLGWQAAVNPEDGLKQTISWFTTRY
jgi:dTDP-glucose 4,6-dehydratase